MKRSYIGIFLSCLLFPFFCSCNEKKPQKKVVINEVLIDNQSNFQDDYGIHSGWIEIFNKAYKSSNLAGCLLKVSSQPGDTITYFIPKGDVLTNIKPRQHALFWADGLPRRGTFHTNFILSKTNSNWIGLYDAGGKLLDDIVVPAGILKTNQSYARVSDASEEWEIKDDSEEKYITPSTNNKTLDSNPKMEKFELHDSIGVGMTVTAMGVVFFGLLLLYICFRCVGKAAIKFRKKNAMKAHNVTDKKEAKERKLGEAPGEVIGGRNNSDHQPRKTQLFTMEF